MVRFLLFIKQNVTTLWQHLFSSLKRQKLGDNFLLGSVEEPNFSIYLPKKMRHFQYTFVRVSFFIEQ
jgi:hypothetical protein